jgi:hypothetical protein
MTRAAESGARRIALMVAMLSTMTAFLIALTPGPARAADCGLLGTSCVVDTVEETAGGAVSTVQETVDQTVDDVVTVVEETVDETVDQVVAVVEETVDTVKKTTDKVVDTVDDTVDTVDDTVQALDPVVPAPADGDSKQGANDSSGGGSRSDTEPAVVRPDRPNRRPAPTLERVALVSGTSPASDTVIVTGTVSTSPFPLEPFAASLPDVARALAFPLLLVGLVLGFVAVQNRLDRKDPKLALATTTPDVLTFE